MFHHPTLFDHYTLPYLPHLTKPLNQSRLLGATVEHRPPLFMKDPHYTFRQGIQLNFWEEMHTVCFGRYCSHYSVLDLTDDLLLLGNQSYCLQNWLHAFSFRNFTWREEKYFLLTTLKFTSAEVAVSVRTLKKIVSVLWIRIIICIKNPCVDSIFSKPKTLGMI